MKMSRCVSQADKNRRMVEQELADTNEKLSDLTCQNQAIQGAKMKCEQEMGVMSHDLDEMQSEAAMSEEKATKSMVDVVRLAEELRNEQDCAMALERDKKLLEAQVRFKLISLIGLHPWHRIFSGEGRFKQG